MIFWGCLRSVARYIGCLDGMCGHIFASLTPCEITPVGRDIYASNPGFTPTLAYVQTGLNITKGRFQDVAAALGTFRVDVVISGNLHRLPQQGNRTISSRRCASPAGGAAPRGPRSAARSAVRPPQ